MNKILSILGLATLFFSINTTSASHLMGGEITYEWKSGHNYDVTLRLYRDCQGVALPTSATIQYTSSCFQGGSFSLSQISVKDIAPICSQDTSTCSGGKTPGVQVGIYKGNVTVNGPCADWVFSFRSCCRNAAITTLSQASAQGLYLESKLDNKNTPFNNSPYFIDDPTVFVNVGIPVVLNFGAIDPDGDSLVCQRVIPKDNATVNCTYNTGYSINGPFGNTCNNAFFPNGELRVTPCQQLVTVVTVEVNEYRQGVKIGSIRRDIQIAVGTQNNDNPELTGMDSTTTFSKSYCVGDTVDFKIHSSDVNGGQNTTLTLLNPLPGMTFTQSGSPWAVGRFTWIVDSADVSPFPYVFYVKVQDDDCPYNGTRIYAYTVWVNSCGKLVWPGDANNDYMANMVDILPIGLAYGATGATRPGASINWTGQSMNDWGSKIPSGVDYKHADCNGDGKIDTTDVLAIIQNYGLTHAKGGGDHTLGSAPLTVLFDKDTVQSGAQVKASIHLGDAVNQAANIYGLTFTIYYDPAKVDSSSISLNEISSWFAPLSDHFAVKYVAHTTGRIEVGITRTNGTNVSGYGAIAELYFTPIVSSSTDVTFTIGNITAIDNKEVVQSLNPGSDKVYVEKWATSIREHVTASFEVYPNPAHSQINISYPGFGNKVYIMLMNQLGETIRKQVVTGGGGYHTLNVSDVPAGVYMIMVNDNNTSAIKKIIVE